jgi:hypothetical protein
MICVQACGNVDHALENAVGGKRKGKEKKIMVAKSNWGWKTP